MKQYQRCQAGARIYQGTMLWGNPTATSPLSLSQDHIYVPHEKARQGFLYTVPAFPATTYNVNPLYVAAAPSLAFLWESLPSPQESKCSSLY